MHGVSPHSRECNRAANLKKLDELLHRNLRIHVSDVNGSRDFSLLRIRHTHLRWELLVLKHSR
jgi:hypothetical protein